ncbi:hypothetical protein CL617_05045 [archaeon]|nr:hypothetical protein [archaeon]|tara:strand:+ start:2999 stop:3559 length:561 start_codon:yes stop_codon:yes gene_type:complete
MVINNNQKIKNSFSKVKEEVNSIKNTLKQLESRVNEVLTQLKNKSEKELFFDISTGNKGVINDQQQSSTINNDDHKSVKLVKEELNELFEGLTDREFSIFVSIYTLEEEFGRSINLSDISNNLKVSEITIRGYINSLISKGLPISKKRPFNKKIELSIVPEFRDIALISRLISIRNKNDQRTLFDA